MTHKYDMHSTSIESRQSVRSRLNKSHNALGEQLDPGGDQRTMASGRSLAANAGHQICRRMSRRPRPDRGGAAPGFRDRPAGTLRLNVPVIAARLTLPAIVPAFLERYPEIRLEVIAEDSFVDVLAAGCDAGIRYEERLEQDMIAVPIGPRVQRFATRRIACLSRSPRQASASARLARARLPAWPVRQWRDGAMGIRMQGRSGEGRSYRPIARAGGGGDRSCGRGGHRRYRYRVSI